MHDKIIPPDRKDPPMVGIDRAQSPQKQYRHCRCGEITAEETCFRCGFQFLKSQPRYTCLTCGLLFYHEDLPPFCSECGMQLVF